MPQLKIVKTATKKQFVGRAIDYKITVTNIGDGNAVNTRLMDALPEGTSFVNAMPVANIAENIMSWNLGTLKPQQSKTVNVKVKALRSGTIKNSATATAVAAKAVTDKASTKIVGVAAILLEVLDTEDPVEVGGTTSYKIIATNQGSAEDHNVKVMLKVEDAMQIISSKGASAGTITGQTITFAPLPKLKAKSKAVWTVTVKGVKSGNVRSTIKMNSDELGREVMETEAQRSINRSS